MKILKINRPFSTLYYSGEDLRLRLIQVKQLKINIFHDYILGNSYTAIKKKYNFQNKNVLEIVNEVMTDMVKHGLMVEVIEPEILQRHIKANNAAWKTIYREYVKLPEISKIMKINVSNLDIKTDVEKRNLKKTEVSTHTLMQLLEKLPKNLPSKYAYSLTKNKNSFTDREVNVILKAAKIILEKTTRKLN